MPLVPPSPRLSLSLLLFGSLQFAVFRLGCLGWHQRHGSLSLSLFSRRLFSTSDRRLNGQLASQGEGRRSRKRWSIDFISLFFPTRWPEFFSRLAQKINYARLRFVITVGDFSFVGDDYRTPVINRLFPLLFPFLFSNARRFRSRFLILLSPGRRRWGEERFAKRWGTERERERELVDFVYR